MSGLLECSIYEWNGTPLVAKVVFAPRAFREHLRRTVDIYRGVTLVQRLVDLGRRDPPRFGLGSGPSVEAGEEMRSRIGGMLLDLRAPCGPMIAGIGVSSRLVHGKVLRVDADELDLFETIGTGFPLFWPDASASQAWFEERWNVSP